MSDLEKLDLAYFKPHQGSIFTLPATEGEDDLNLELQDVSDLPDRRPEGEKSGRAPFVLVFACKTTKLPQGVYRLEHETLDPLEIFLSPFEAYEDGHRLESIFN